MKVPKIAFKIGAELPENGGTDVSMPRLSTIVTTLALLAVAGIAAGAFWWQSIPEDIRPRKEQPYYHLLAENDETTYVAYVSEQNLVPDDSGKPVAHPQVPEMFGAHEGSHYEVKPFTIN